MFTLRLQISNWLGVIERSAGHVTNHQKIINDNRYEYWYNHWEDRRQDKEEQLNSVAATINDYSSEGERINERIQPDLDRINHWLTPLIQSHNNLVLSFNDRARVYVKEVAKQTGSYAKREDLRSEYYLKPFYNHMEYIRCLKEQHSKTTGECYAQTLVHVLNDDGTVDTEQQAIDRANVNDDVLLDVEQFWRNRRFFCSVYYGYSCPYKYQEQIRQIAKTIHVRQCARMSDEQREQQEQDSAPCETGTWNDTNTANGQTSPQYRYLMNDVADISNNLNNFYATLVSEHQNEVTRLVSYATRNTYQAESNYHDIIRPNGNLWQASTASVTEIEDDADPSAFVLLHKGEVQNLTYTTMNTVERAALRDLKSHQTGIALLLDTDNLGAYQRFYLAVQDQAEEAERIYQEIDQVYAQASSDENFDDDAFNQTKKIYWQAQDINAKGQIKQAQYGNGTVTQWSYDQFGRINGHFTQNAHGQTLLNNTYQYDAIGNLSQRMDYVEDVAEDFSYDQMNRLVQNRLSGTGASYVNTLQQNVVNYAYDEIGNLTYKSDIKGGGINGSYTYGTSSQHAGPHAVTHITGLGNFTYDRNGNQLTGNGRNVTYNAFNKPTSIIKQGKNTQMWYGPERQLIEQRQPTPQGLETTQYVGGLFEQITIQGGGITHRHHIAVAGNPIAVIDTQAGSLTPSKESYLHKNHQSSVLAISDVQGNVAERRYYDAFGDIKSYIGQAQYSAGLGYTTATSMGFTGHRTLVLAGVIHMGGRVYDATIGRFLSADPHIQSPLNSQSLNRYSYTLNNPLSWTDPSGYFFKSIFKALKKIFNKIKKIIKAVLKVVKKVLRTIAKVIKKIGQFIKKYARVIIAVVAAVATPFALAAILGKSVLAFTLPQAIAAGAASGGISGLISTGSLKGALEGAFFGAITAGFAKGLQFGQIGTKAINGIKAIGKGTQIAKYAKQIFQVVAHGVIGGARAVVNGGKFFAGFVAGAVGKAFTIVGNAVSVLSKNIYVQGLTVAAAGGLGSRLAGGSFELGFLTAGLAFAVNQVVTQLAQKRNTLDNVQTGLDVAGLTPVVGIVADGVNTVISVFRGDLTGAGLSAAAMIPGAGQAVTGAKLGKALVTAEPVVSALKSDVIHRSASFVRSQAAQSGTHFRLVGGDGVTRTLTQIPGALNNQAGRFEFIVDGSKLTHQRFVTGGSINGVPNRP